MSKQTDLINIPDAITVSGSNNIGIGTSNPLDALHIASAVSTDYRGNVFLQDTTTMTSGVGGQLTFGGNYTSSGIITEWSAIQGTKSNASNDYSGQIEFKTRKQGYALETKMTLDSSGHVTTPNQPAFRAGYTSGSTITNNVNSVHPFTNTAFNRGNHYNTTNSRFTAPVAGVYTFSACFWVNANNNADFAPKLNGSSYIPSAPNSDAIIFAQLADSYIQNLAGTFTIELAANDYIDIRSRNYTSNYYAGHSWWEGHLIG